MATALGDDGPVPNCVSHDRDQRALVSVIIPAFNRVELLGRAISSALDQTYHHLEVLVVDDGSVEDVKAVLRGFDDPRLSYHRRDVNKGISAARNRGISLAKGDYLAFLDSDDEWKREKIRSQMARLRLRGPDYRVCYTTEEVIDASGKREQFTDFTKEGDILTDLLSEMAIGMSTLMVERSVLADSGGFNEKIGWGEDWELCLRIAQHSPFACVAEPLTLYHRHDKGRITDNIEGNPSTARSLMVIYDENKALFRKNRRAWGDMLVTIGYYQVTIGQRKAAARSFLGSAAHNPLQRSAYLSLARLALGWRAPQGR